MLAALCLPYAYPTPFYPALLRRSLAPMGGYWGGYSNYNNGWGYGIYMENNGNINTGTLSMTPVGNGYGQFTIHWDTSEGT